VSESPFRALGLPGRPADPAERDLGEADDTDPVLVARDEVQASEAWGETIRVSRLVRQLPGRIWRGRPLRLLARALAACLLALAVLHLVPGQPAAPALVTGLILGFLLTARSDLAPPPER
jgi:hypothetical protein